MAIGERTPLGTTSSELIYPSSRQILPDVPPSAERKRQLDPMRLYVATHELQHALVGMQTGLTVNEISTIPEGNIGGYTLFAPTSNISGFQIAAAASMVYGPHGEPSGFGHDAFQVDYLSNFGGTLSLGQAINTASEILGAYSLKVREKAAEIIAFRGIVSGFLIGTILERAKREVEEENRVKVMLPDIEDKNIEEKVDVQSEFTIVMKKLPNGEVIEEIIEVKVCGRCGGRSHHLPGCEVEEDNTIFYAD